MCRRRGESPLTYLFFCFSATKRGAERLRDPEGGERIVFLPFSVPIKDPGASLVGHFVSLVSGLLRGVDSAFRSLP